MSTTFGVIPSSDAAGRGLERRVRDIVTLEHNAKESAGEAVASAHCRQRGEAARVGDDPAVGVEDPEPISGARERLEQSLRFGARVDEGTCRDTPRIPARRDCRLITFIARIDVDDRDPERGFDEA